MGVGKTVFKNLWVNSLQHSFPPRIHLCFDPAVRSALDSHYELAGSLTRVYFYIVVRARGLLFFFFKLPLKTPLEPCKLKS